MTRKPKPKGLVVMCVSCKQRRMISWEDAAKIKDVVFCEKDGMPMVVMEAVR